MIDLDKNRMQTEAIARMDDFKKHYKENQHENERDSFLSKFLKPLELFNSKSAERNINVLYCEDCKLLGKIIRKFLESKGFDVTVSETPIPFLSKDHLKQFDFVITDNNMPYMTGTQFTEYVEKELNLEIPMYMFTGDSHLKEELPITKVRRGIFIKGSGFEKTFQAILADFEKYKQELSQRMEMRLTITANTLVC